MKVQIVLNYKDIETQVFDWATSEDRIDFRKNLKSAARCTAAFAALELKAYLARTLINSDISIVPSRKEPDFFIELEIDDVTSNSAEFSLEPKNGGFIIRGKSRKGLLYGVYEFLRLNGWRWHAPGQDGEIAPLYTDKLLLPNEKQDYTPSMPLGRSFDLVYLSMESIEMYLWMARNRMDLTSYRPLTSQLCRKLCMSFKNGGHIFEEILNPDRIMSSGHTLWEEHEDWFGLPADGIRVKEPAQKIQFCVSKEELIDFLGEEIIKLASGIWQEADRLEIWGFDTWGSSCNCEGCKNLGNGSDRMLHFLSKLRNIVDAAVQSGRLDHAVKLVMCSYEGTSTIEAPLNPTPANLAVSGDCCVFYPILRCYAHNFSDNSCLRNIGYTDALKKWLSLSPGIPFIVGEYYNVSKFEDLPLLFTDRIINDIPYYHSLGVRGMTYMHVPMVNWGMRTLTQLLYAQIIWDVNTDADSFLKEYYSLRYGPYAEKIREAYRLTEEAWALSASWRAWGDGSVLTQLQKWDGKTPDKPLSVDTHFKTAEGAIKSGRKSIRFLGRAMNLLNAAIREAQFDLLASPADAAAVVNPIEQRRYDIHKAYEKNLSEDRRLLRYGLDTMHIMTLLVQYHNACYLGENSEALKFWKSIEKSADKMDQYYVPIGYNWPGPGLVSTDALSRTQTRALIAKIRSNLPL